MTTPVILILLLMVTSWISCDATCQTLSLSGSRYQANKLGIFHLQPDSFNDRAVYKHQCARLFLFFVSAHSVRFWIVGPEVGRNAGFLMSRDAAVDPTDVTSSSWRAWDDGMEAWEDDTVDVQCRGICSTVTVAGAYDGQYELLADLQHDRPAYYSSQTQVYMYYLPGAYTCPRWVFGSILGDLSFKAFIFSSAMNLYDTIHSWNVLVPRISTVNVTVQCIEPTAPTDTCGNRLVRDAVAPMLLYGTDAYYGKWPFMASLSRDDGNHKCGATLISDRHVITAAHCVSTDFNYNATITVGVFDLDDPEPTARQYQIRDVYIHPNFSLVDQPFEIYHDVAILRLASAVDIGTYVQPACLPRHVSDPLPVKDSSGNTSASDFHQCQLLGWGRTDNIGTKTDKLQDLRIDTFYSMDVCGAAYFPAFPWMPQSEGLCVKAVSGGKMCKGDSGSPVICKSSSSGQWFVVGIGSWGFITCLNFNTPSIYTPTDYVMDWVNHVTAL